MSFHFPITLSTVRKITSSLFIGAFVFLFFAPLAHAASIWSMAGDGSPAGSGTWAQMNAPISTTVTPPSTSGSVTAMDTYLYTWFTTADPTVQCKINGSVVDTATFSYATYINQTYSGSLPTYGSHTYHWGEINVSSIPWAGSGCNYSAGDTVSLDWWNGSGHNYVTGYDPTNTSPFGSFGTASPAGDSCTLGTAGTCVDTVTPAGDASPWPNAEATSTTFAFGATGYNDSSSDGVTLNINYRNNAQNGNLLAGVGFAFNGVSGAGYVSGTYTVPLSFGSFTFSTSTSIQQIGQYTLTTTITQPWASIFGFNVGSQTLISTTTQFEVSTSTQFDQLSQTVANQVATLQAEGSANCTINFSSALDLTTYSNCLIYFIVPSQAQIQNAFQSSLQPLETQGITGYAYTTGTALLGYSVATSSLAASDLQVTFPNTGIFANATASSTINSTSSIAGKTVMFIDFNQLSNSMQADATSTALVQLNNLLNVFFTVGFLFWLWNFVTRVVLFSV